MGGDFTTLQSMTPQVGQINVGKSGHLHNNYYEQAMQVKTFIRAEHR